MASQEAVEKKAIGGEVCGTKVYWGIGPGLVQSPVESMAKCLTQWKTLVTFYTFFSSDF